MAQDLVINGKIVIDDSQASAPVKSIKAQLKEANAELIQMSEKFGETSTEAVNAAKKVADLKDRIGDAKALTEAFSPDKKFQAFSQALSGVAGGFAALQGAQALFGVKSKELEETLLKVQGAMALSQGLSAITESIDAFKNLGTVIKSTTAFQLLYNTATRVASAVTTSFGIAVDETAISFKVLRGALISTGIGALVVAIGFAIEKIVEWTESTDKQKSSEEVLKKAEKELEDQIKKTNDAIASRNAIDSFQLKLNLSNAKARGASLEELRKIENDYYYNARLNAQTAEEDEIKKTATIKEQYGENSEIYKKQLEQQNKISQDKYKINQEWELLESQRKQDDYNKQIEQQKKNNDKSKQLTEQHNKEIADAEKDLQKQLSDLRTENYLQSIKDEQERAEQKLIIDFENQREIINNSIASEETKSKLLKEIELKYQNDLDKIKSDAFDKKQQQIAKQSAYEEDTFKILNDIRINNIKDANDKAYELEEQRYKTDIDAALQALNNKEITEQEYKARREALTQQHEANVTAIENKGSEERKNIAKAEAALKQTLYSEVGNAFGALSDLIGKQTGVGKALALAQIAIDTALAISSLTKNSEANPTNAVTSGVSGAIQFATGLVRILANIKKAKDLLSSAKTPSGGGGGGSLPLPSLGGAVAPLQPQLATTMMNQAQINQLSSATTRAFVLESDVTNNQERIIRLNRAARIN